MQGKFRSAKLAPRRARADRRTRVEWSAAILIALLLATSIPFGFQGGAEAARWLPESSGWYATAPAIAGTVAIGALALTAALLIYFLCNGRRRALVQALNELERAQEINEQEVSRRALEASENRFRAIANLAPNMVWSKPPTGPVDYLNDRWFEFTGVTPIDDGAASWEESFHPDDLPLVRRSLESAASGDLVGDAQYRLRDRTGAYRTVLSRMTAVRDERDGQVLRLMGTLTDIQDLVDSREAVATALAAAEAHKAHLRLILDSVPDAMIVVDDGGVIRSFSAAAEAMFGWTAEEVIGRKVNVLMPEPYQANHDSYLARHIATGETNLLAGRVLVGLRRDGSTFPFEMSLGGLQSDGRRFFTSFMRDLSERRATEQRLHQLQTELAHVSRLSAMGGMAAGMAHELNQPLMAATSFIQGSSRLLQRDDPPLAEVIQAMSEAAREVLRAGEIIRRTRQFVSQGLAECRPEAIEPLLREAGALAMIGAKDSGISMRYRISRKLPPALVDRVQIQQVVVNLVRNAAEAMAQSARRELIIAASKRSAGLIEVSVADTGPGLAPEVAAELFHPFVTTKPSGMGLGLSISRTIIEGQGGRIWARPRAGGGTVFHFTIRAADEEKP